MAALTAYPDPNVETTTVDGYVCRDSQTESWATCHDNSTGSGAADNVATSNMCYTGDNTSPDQKWLYRGIFLFNTSGIGDTDSVDAGVFSVYVTSIYDEDLGTASADYSTVTTSNPASNTAITTSDFDYNDFGTTHLSDDFSHISSPTHNAFVNWTLNTDGKSAVSKTGVTKLALRSGYDVSNTAPVSPVGDNYNGITGGTWADQTGTSSDPRLSVVYGAATLDSYYPDPDAETTTVDGMINVVVDGASTSTTWGNANAGTSLLSNFKDDSINRREFIQGEEYANFQVLQSRGYFLFNTASLSDTVTIDSGAISFFSSADGDTSEATYPANISLVASTPASNTAIVTGDYTNVGSTKFASDYTGTTYNASVGYHNLSLNTDGKNAISKTGVTKFATRPSNSFSSATNPQARYYLFCYFADDSGTGRDPVLSLSFTETTADFYILLEGSGNGFTRGVRIV